MMSASPPPSPAPSGQELRKLKALAQGLDPHLKVGKSGVTDALVQSLDELLGRHQLVKVKFVGFKEQKDELGAVLAIRTGSHLIWRVGHVVMLYRAKAPAPEATTAGRAPD